MPLYFIIFLTMLALSVLFYVSALAFVIVRRRTLPIWIRGVAASRMQCIGVALMWWGVGVGWLLFFNIYRIHLDMNALGDAAMQAFSRGYTTRLPIVVLPYGASCLLWILAMWSEPARVSRRALWGLATLSVLTILITPFAAGAQGDMQEHGFSQHAYQQLQLAHLARCVFGTIAAVWGIAEGWRLPKNDTAPST